MCGEYVCDDCGDVNVVTEECDLCGKATCLDANCLVCADFRSMNEASSSSEDRNNHVFLSLLLLVQLLAWFTIVKQ
jgi:hypothetical protein